MVRHWGNQCWSVGNGRYVYDIAPWAPHHPGGRLVLNQVVGTDITVDFFNEADFDGAAYTPLKGLGKKHGNVPRSHAAAAASAHRMLSRVEYEAGRGSVIKSESEFDDDGGLQVNLSESEWTAVRKARMTHRHGKFAVQKLVSSIAVLFKVPRKLIILLDR